MIPYAEITEAADRRWTFRLLERLIASDLLAEEVDALAEALQTVSDPRSVAPLEAVICDTARPATIRMATSSILRGMEHLVPDVPEATLRRWWREGDAILRRHALLSMDDIDCPDIVLAVAKDPGHEFHDEALGLLQFSFDLPEHQEIKIAALAHPDPRVRETAAVILVWDEPIRAEGPLIEATRDPVPAVAAEACKTLQYYPSLRVVSCLHELLRHPAETVRREADISLEYIRDEFLWRLLCADEHAAPRLRRWMAPLWDVLAFTDEELNPGAGCARSARTDEPPEAVPATKLLDLLADPDASPKSLQEALFAADWQGFTSAERGRLRAVLLRHPDPLVREQAAWALEAWQDAGGLLALVRDADFGVRKVAMYRLGLLPPTPGIANLAWEHLQRPDALGCHATETLATFVRHADPAVAVQRLGWIAGDHGWREALRAAAVDHLRQLRAAEEIRQLSGLLQEAPALTWALHIELLDAIAGLELPPPDIRHLEDVDNLDVQDAIARFDA